MIEITESGQGYLRDLLAKQNCEGIAIRVFVLDGGTPKAETCIAFCRPGEQEAEGLATAEGHALERNPGRCSAKGKRSR